MSSCESYTKIYNSLPDDLQEFIKKEYVYGYLEEQTVIQSYKQIVKSDSSRALFLSNPYMQVIVAILNNNNIVRELCNIDEEFKRVFTQIFVNKQRIFIRIEDPIRDFALSLLYNKYH